jgi:hypothetical protein
MASKKKKKQQQSSKAVWIAVIILIAAGALYYYSARAPAETNQTAVPEPAAGIAKGDLVAINYALTLTNGTVVDTNNETLARQYGVDNYVKGPFRFIAGQSDKVKGFDDAILGLTLGQRAIRTIAPSEPVLEYVVNRTRSVVRNQPYPRFMDVRLAKYEQAFRKKAVINDVAYNASMPWAFKVINVSDESARLEPIVQEGKEYQLPGLEWKSALVIKTHNDLVFRHNPVDGQTMNTEFGTATVRAGPGIVNITYPQQQGDVFTYYAPVQEAISIPYQFRVTESSDAQFTIRRINYPPQETLLLNVEVLEWEEDVKDVKDKPLIVQTT